MQKSRQVQRAEFREEMKLGASRRKAITRQECGLLLEKRKAAPSSLREAAMSKSRTSRRKIRKGKEFGRILWSVIRHGYEASMHATKGVRVHRA